MNNCRTLLIFSVSLVALSCSSFQTNQHPSIDAGATRLAISTDLSDNDVFEVDAAGTDYGYGTNTSSTSLNLTAGQVLASNFELGATLLIEGAETKDLNPGGDTTSENMTAVGLYARYYVPLSSNILPWVQAKIFFTGDWSKENFDFSTFEDVDAEGDVWGTALSLGLSNYLSEKTALELALTTTSMEYSDISASDSLGSVTLPQGFVRETSGTTVTFGISTYF